MRSCAKLTVWLKFSRYSAIVLALCIALRQLCVVAASGWRERVVAVVRRGLEREQEKQGVGQVRTARQS